jgi:hypothetical protein
MEWKKMSLKYAFAVLALTGFLGSTLAQAQTDFRQLYDPTHWSTSNTNADGGVAWTSGGVPTHTVSVQITGGNNGTFSSGNTDLSIVIPNSAPTDTIQFDWTYSSVDNTFFDDAAYYVINGGSPVLLGNDTSGPFSGHATIPVNANDILDLRVATGNNAGGPGILNVFNFDAPLTVPEPASMALALLGGGILLRRRRRA